MDQAEQLRKMVSQQKKPRSAARVMTVTSGKGGVGKSSLSVNLALALERLGKRVIIFDADFGLANIEVMLGIRPQYNLADLMFRGKTIQDIITEGPEGIGFISGGSGIHETSRMNREQIIYLTERLVELDKLTDIILIDTGAGISDAVMEFLASSAEILLISTPEPTSITDAYALLKTLKRKPEFRPETTQIHMISNRISSLEEGYELFDKLSVVSEKFLNIQLQYLGGIVQDSAMQRAVLEQRPVVLSYPHAQSAREIVELADILYGSASVQTGKRGIAQLFSNFIKASYRKKINS